MFDNDDYDAMFGSTTTTTTDDADDFNVLRWKLGNHNMKPTIDADELRQNAADNEDINDDLADVLQQAAIQVEQAKVRDFQCPVCGLSHGHSDSKHDIRTAVNVTEQFAEMMQFNPACHCGVNELAVLIDFYGYIVPQVFEDDDQFIPFEEMMPSDETDAALTILGHPDVVVGEATSNIRAGKRATTGTLRNLADGGSLPDAVDEVWVSLGQVLQAARLQDTDEMRASMTALDKRFKTIRSAGNSAPIPKDTETKLASLRQDLERRSEAASDFGR